MGSAASSSVNFVAGSGFSLGSYFGLCLSVQRGVHTSHVCGDCMCYFGFSRLCSFILDLRQSFVELQSKRRMGPSSNDEFGCLESKNPFLERSWIWEWIGKFVDKIVVLREWRLMI